MIASLKSCLRETLQLKLIQLDQAPRLGGSFGWISQPLYNGPKTTLMFECVALHYSGIAFDGKRYAQYFHG
jgi:hypothetical protein